MTQSKVGITQILLAHGVITEAQIEDAWRINSAEGGADLTRVLVRKGILSQDLVDGLNSVYANLVWRYLGPKDPEHSLLRVGAVSAKDLARVRRIREEVRKRCPNDVPSVAQVLIQTGILTDPALRAVLTAEEVPTAAVVAKSAGPESAPVVAQPVRMPQRRTPTPQRSQADPAEVPTAPVMVPTFAAPFVEIARKSSIKPLDAAKSEEPARVDEAVEPEPRQRDFRLMFDFELRAEPPKE